MKFPYIKLPGPDSQKPWFSRPLIPIRLYGPSGSLPLRALVDSGADRALFHESIGRELGLDVRSGPVQDFYGIEGGRVAVFLHRIRLSVDGLPGEIELSAGFTESAGVHALLGQEGFFDAFKVVFERKRGIVELTRVAS